MRESLCVAARERAEDLCVSRERWFARDGDEAEGEDALKRERERDHPLAIERSRKVDTWLPGKGHSNSRGARPVYENHFDD